MDNLSYLDNEDVYGCNLFAYCNDNPVMYSDETGHILELIIPALIGIAVKSLTYPMALDKASNMSRYFYKIWSNPGGQLGVYTTYCLEK